MFAQPPPAPRAVSLFGAAGWNARFCLMFGGMFGGMPLVMVAALLVLDRPPWTDWALDARAVRVEAQAVEVRSTYTSVNDEDLFDVVVRFQDRRGKTRTATVSTTDASLLATARAKGPVSIEYDPEDPSLARLPGHPLSHAGALFFLPLAFAAIGLPLFVWGLASALRARCLYRRGHAAVARVLEVVATLSSEGDDDADRVMSMRYAFATAAGEVSGAWKTKAPLGVGATLWVVYDPSEPARNMPSLS